MPLRQLFIVLILDIIIILSSQDEKRVQNQQIICNNKQVLNLNDYCILNDVNPPKFNFKISDNVTLFWQQQNDTTIDFMVKYQWSGFIEIGYIINNEQSQKKNVLVHAKITNTNRTLNGLRVQLINIETYDKSNFLDNKINSELILKGYLIQNNQTFIKFSMPIKFFNNLNNNTLLFPELPLQWYYNQGNSNQLELKNEPKRSLLQQTCPDNQFSNNNQCVTNNLNPSQASVTLENGQIEIFWEFQNNMQPPSIDFLVVYNKNCWMGLGFGPNMQNTDMIAANINGNNIILNDLYSVGHKTPNSQQNQNLTLLGQSVTSSQIMFKFRRPTNTGHSQDQTLLEGQTYLFCLAYSNSQTMQMHTTDYTFQVTLNSIGHSVAQILDESLMDWHKVFLFWGWGLAIDIAIIVSRFCRMLPYYIEIHAILIDLLFIGTMILEFMVVNQNKDQLTSINNEVINCHYIMGLMFAGLVFLQILTGIVLRSKINQISIKMDHTQVGKVYLNQIKKVHYVLGVLVYLIGKVMLFTGKYISSSQQQQSNSLLQAGILLIIIVLLRIILELLFYYKPQWLQNLIIKMQKSSQHNESQQLKQQELKTITNQQLQQSYNVNNIDESFVQNNKSQMQNQPRLDQHLLTNIEQNEDLIISKLKRGMSPQQIRKLIPQIEFVIYQNYICSLKGFFHPGGEFIKTAVIGREVDRFIYGGHQLETLAKSDQKAYDHSVYAVNYLIGKQIGQINASFFQYQFENISSNQAWLQGNFLNTNNATWRCINIIPISNNLKQFVFQCNQNIQLSNMIPGVQWIGRHITLQSCNKNFQKTKRIYTVVLCYLEYNIKMRNKIIEYWQSGFQSNILKQQQQQYNNNNNESNQFCLLIKKYQYKGSFTQYLYQNWQQEQFKIEGPFGLGLQLTPQTKGKFVIFTGGTGVLPFLDLFDFLIKKSVFEIIRRQKKDNDANNFDLLNLGLEECLNEAQFQLVASFNSQDEFYGKEMIKALYKINNENQLSYFDATIRFSDNSIDQDLKIFTERLQGKGLQHVLLQNEKDILKQIQAFFLCGPISMTSQVYYDLLELGVDHDKINIV